jgi:hypothetical protein
MRKWNNPAPILGINLSRLNTPLIQVLKQILSQALSPQAGVNFTLFARVRRKL